MEATLAWDSKCRYKRMSNVKSVALRSANLLVLTSRYALETNKGFLLKLVHDRRSSHPRHPADIGETLYMTSENSSNQAIIQTSTIGLHTELGDLPNYVTGRCLPRTHSRSDANPRSSQRVRAGTDCI